ncbi:MAG: ImmA/IrrE family metallo-endopeptidase [Oscillospiraceae bacterium]
MTNRNILEEADRLLLNNGIPELPLTLRKAEQIARLSGWVIATYQESEELIKACGAENVAKKHPAFTLVNDGRNIVLYNNDLSYEHKLYCICHEFGHIVLKHTSEKNVLGISHDPAETARQEQEANDFAAELLAPACVMSRLGVKSAEQLRKYGLISPEQALRHIENIKPTLPSTTVEKVLCERLGRRHIRISSNAIIAVIAALVLVLACLGIINRQSRPEEVTISRIESTSADPESSNSGQEETAVYITRTGEKYHKPDCYHIAGKTGLIELTIEEAEQAGYEPCKDCF